jgi:signal transduction histidine kinase
MKENQPNLPKQTLPEFLQFGEIRMDLLEILFERMPMGIVVFDRDLKIVRCNPTWAEFIERYTPSKASDVQPGKTLAELAPGAENFFLPAVERVFRGETVYIEAMRSISAGIESFWDVAFSPLYQNGEVVGILDVTTDATERIQVLRNLESRVEERTREVEHRREIAEGMRDIIRMINDKMPLGEFLQKVSELAANRMGAAASIIQRFDLEKQQLTYLASYQMPFEMQAGFSRPFESLDNQGTIAYLDLIAKRKPIYGNYPPYPERLDVLDEDNNFPETYKNLRRAIREKFAGSLLVPLLVQNEIYGGMTFYYTEPQDFTEEQVQLSVIFAEQISLAIENARLLETSAEAATLSERNRLARDLHDAVSQTLFSASLIADVLPKLWQRNPDAAQQKLNELGQLTRGALSEMRTLLLELRPTSLADIDLGDLLRHLVNAFIGRTRTPAVLEISGQIDPPAEVKSVFYRVAQEALNNIGKHAQATQVQLHLARAEGQARLEVRDNGRGFNPNSSRPGSLGLGIMRERAESIAAQLTLESRPGAGTKLVLTWKQQEK